jgi:hypothetical protein
MAKVIKAGTPRPFLPIPVKTSVPKIRPGDSYYSAPVVAREKITKMRVLKVQKTTEGHRIDLQVEVSGVPPTEAVGFSKEVSTTGPWAAWFKSLCVE